MIVINVKNELVTDIKSAGTDLKFSSDYHFMRIF